MTVPAIDIADCAIVCFEMQRGVVGDLASMQVIRDAVEQSGVIAQIARLMSGCRKAGIPVIHMTAARRADGRGGYANMPYIQQHLAKLKDDPAANSLVLGNPGVEVVPELSAPDDIVLIRFHGVSGFHDTGLDTMLRSLGKGTIILVGSSVNRGVTGTAIEGINRGYTIVTPREAVCGYPLEYRDMMLEHSLKAIAHIPSVDEILALLEASS